MFFALSGENIVVPHPCRLLEVGLRCWHFWQYSVLLDPNEYVYIIENAEQFPRVSKRYVERIYHIHEV